MSQRNSGRKRKRLDHYRTPAWVVRDGLAPFLPLSGARIVDPCCGSGSMVRALESCGASVLPSDIHDYRFGKKIHSSASEVLKEDFLSPTFSRRSVGNGFCINPPYGSQGALAVKFIERALGALHESQGRMRRFAAFLLPVDFDSASSRVALFGACSWFAFKVVLLRRIEWFPRGEGPRVNPSSNHAWFVYFNEPRPWAHAQILYAPIAGYPASQVWKK